jgi:anti-sigma factor RsiW
MTEQPQHPDYELVELALGELGEPERSQLVRHLVSCPQCRSDYDDVLAAVDGALPAAPHIAPPVGFEQRVMTTIGVLANRETTTEHTTPPHPRRSRLRLALAAAAVVLAAVAGGAAAIAIWGDDDTPPEPILTAQSAALRNAGGDIVGTAAVSSVDGKPVIVVSLSDPPIGVPYHCRVMLASGRTVDSESWTDDAPGGSTWIINVPEGRVIDLEVVTNDGRVWSHARMP